MKNETHSDAHEKMMNEPHHDHEMMQMETDGHDMDIMNHGGHMMHMGDMSKKLKVAIVLMIPLLLISPIAGFTILKFPGSEITNSFSEQHLLLFWNSFFHAWG